MADRQMSLEFDSFERSAWARIEPCFGTLVEEVPMFVVFGQAGVGNFMQKKH